MEDNSYTVTSVISETDSDVQAELDSLAMDFDSVFQSGGNANNFVNAVNAANSIITGKIVETFMTKVTTAVMDRLNAAISELLSLPNIAGMVASKVSTAITNAINEIIAELTGNKLTEKINDILGKINPASILNKIMAWINTQVEKIRDKILKKINIDKIKEKVASIMQYVAQGPIWVDACLTSLANMIIKSAIKEINEFVKSINKIKEKMVEKLIDKIVMVEVIKIIESVKPILRKAIAFVAAYLYIFNNILSIIADLKVEVALALLGLATARATLLETIRKAKEYSEYLNYSNILTKYGI